MIHWEENNTSIHHGGAGLNALGFAPGRNPDQLTMDYVFDDHAKQRSRTALQEQLPRLIYDGDDADVAPTLENLFGLRCNDTPVVRDLLEEVLLSLRAEGEISIVDETGATKPRAKTIAWTDRIVLSPQRSFFGPFCQISRPKDVTKPD